MPSNTTINDTDIKPIDTIRELLAADLAEMQQLIRQQLNSKIPLIETIAQYIIDGGGKQIRPLLILLSAKLFNYQGNAHYQMGTVIEFVHTATLLHDDVIDTSSMRRGKTAAHEIWGNQASVLVGDFLYSRAFQILTKHQHNEVLTVLANATNAIVEAEMNQLVHKHKPELTEAIYLDIIRGKTASLFSAASEIGAILSGADSKQQQALADYGLAIGTAFQIIDDLLDYTGSTEAIGKNLGDDLAEGKVTLPLIFTLQQCSTKQRQTIEQMIITGNTQQLALIIETMQYTSAITATQQRAQHYASAALATLQELPNNRYRQALEQLVHFATSRQH